MGRHGAQVSGLPGTGTCRGEPNGADGRLRAPRELGVPESPYPLIRGTGEAPLRSTPVARTGKPDSRSVPERSTESGHGSSQAEKARGGSRLFHVKQPTARLRRSRPSSVIWPLVSDTPGSARLVVGS